MTKNKNNQKPAYSYIVHDFYGCESGCCGHRFILCAENGDELERRWEFTHPYGENKEQWAEQMCKGQWNVPVRLDLCDVSED